MKETITIRNIRLEKKLTQEEAAKVLGVSRRTYIKYEQEGINVESYKYRFIIQTLQNFNKIDETHGILSINEIEEACSAIFKKYDVEYVILFGSYAKNKASETSDVDLLICSTLKGIKFFGLVEELREALKKKVDALDESQLESNAILTHEILKEGIRIYG